MSRARPTGPSMRTDAPEGNDAFLDDSRNGTTEATGTTDVPDASEAAGTSEATEAAGSTGAAAATDSDTPTLRNRQIRDFTRGSVPRHLITFSIPMLLGNLLQALYNTVDSIWVGRFVGSDALAAVSVGFPVIFALVALIIGITMATTVLVSQYFGARRADDVVRTINNSLLLLVVLGGLASVAGVVLRRPLLRLINTPPEIIDMAASYLGIFMTGLVPIFLYNAVGSILRGLGDSRTPLKFLAFATVFNIILDPFLIFGLGPFPAMGVAGAALATVIAISSSAVIALRYLYVTSGIVTFRPGAFRFDWNLTKLTFRIGLPTGIQQVMVSLSALAVTAIVNSFGPTVVAGFGAAARLDQFAFLPAMSISIGVSALVGQNLGAGRTDRVRQTVRWGALMAGGVTAVAALVAVLKPDILLVLFTRDSAVLTEGSLYLRYVGLAYVPLALMFTLSGVLRGAGDTTPPMVFTLISLWLVRVPFARYLSTTVGLGPVGIWMAVAASPYIGLLLNYVYYWTGRWKTKAVARRAGADEGEGAGGPGAEPAEPD